jgi:hypothetical protein
MVFGIRIWVLSNKDKGLTIEDMGSVSSKGISIFLSTKAKNT